MSATSLISFADFERLPDVAGKQELIDGEGIVSPPPIRSDFFLTKRSEQVLLRAFDRRSVWMEAGFKIGEHCVQPDVAVIWPDQPEDGKYWAGAPAIAVEVHSPGNTARELQRKIELYLLNPIRSAKEVWVVDDKRKSVVLYRAGHREIIMTRESEQFVSAYGNLLVHISDLFS